MWHPIAVQAAPQCAGSRVAGVSEKSIAVLPFVDMSEKRDQEYFSDGLSEELLDISRTIPDLRVIARTSSFAFKGKNGRHTNIAQDLGVANLLEGSVRKAGNQLRITAQLIRAAEVCTCGRRATNASSQTSSRCRRKSPRQWSRGSRPNFCRPRSSPHSTPHNMDAYNLYLRGQYFARRASE